MLSPNTTSKHHDTNDDLVELGAMDRYKLVLYFLLDTITLLALVTYLSYIFTADADRLDYRSDKILISDTIMKPLYILVNKLDARFSSVISRRIVAHRLLRVCISSTST